MTVGGLTPETELADGNLRPIQDENGVVHYVPFYGDEATPPGDVLPGPEALTTQRKADNGEQKLNTHGDIDEYVKTNKLTTPKDWPEMTILQKKDWISKNG